MNNEQISLEQSVKRFPAKHRVNKEYEQLCNLNDKLRHELDQQVYFCRIQKETLDKKDQQVAELREKFNTLVHKIQELNDLIEAVSKI